MDQQGKTDRTIPNNKLDIVIRDKEKGTCLLIHIAISGDRNAIKKETEKILILKDLIMETQRMWSVKTKVIPLITGQLEPSSNHSENTGATNRESTKSGNCRKKAM